MTRFTGIAIASLLLVISTAQFSAAGEGSLHGKIYFDYTMDLSGKPQGPNNTFDFRRLFFTYDTPLAGRDDLRARIRTDIKKDTGIKVKAWRPYVKRAWIRWQRSPTSHLAFGLLQNNGYRIQEKLWGHRWLEKSALDKWGIIKSDETGIEIGAKLGEGLKVDFQITNGPSSYYENDDQKRFGGAFQMDGGPLTIRVYAGLQDYDDKELTLAGIASVSIGDIAVGGEFAQQNNQNGTNGLDERLISAFVRAPLKGKMGVLARADFIDLNNMDTDDNETLYVIGGVTYQAAESLRLGATYRFTDSDDVLHNVHALFFTTEVLY